MGLCGAFLFLFAALLMNASAVPPKGELGQEMKRVQQDLLNKTAEPAKTSVVKIAVSATNAEPAAVPSPKGSGYAIKTLEIRGDVSVLERAGLLHSFKDEVEGHTLSGVALRAICDRYEMMLITNQVSGGYLAASIKLPLAQDYASGKAVINVLGGQPGRMTFYDKPKETNAPVQPFSARYFSLKQIERKLAAVTNEPYFNYNTFYNAVFALNSHPDLNVDTDLKLRTTAEQRYIDMDYKVTEYLPLHAVLDLRNNGTDVTGQWRAGLTVQDLNLTRHDDVLTVSIPVSVPDISKIQSVAVSYYLPHDLMQGGALTLFGGYSKMKADDLFNSPDPSSRLSSSGRGYFGGFQTPFTLVRNSSHLVTISPGLVYRVVEDTLTLGSGAGAANVDRNLTLTPFSVSISYNTASSADALGGRNFVALDTSYNPGSLLGGSDDKEITVQRAVAKSEYFVERLHAARLQPFAGKKDDRGNATSGQWLVFLRAEVQYASSPLIPADQFGIGGLDSVRGYPDRVVQGDDGYTATAELRTPIISGLMFKKSAGDDAKKGWFTPVDRLQFITFADAGYIRVQDTILGDPGSESIYSAGVGFRLQLTENILARADWGVPFGYSSLIEKSSKDFASAGRGHFSVQAQF